eukprot:5473909-Amphidinium_carterae.1
MTACAALKPHLWSNLNGVEAALQEKVVQSEVLQVAMEKQDGVALQEARYAASRVDRSPINTKHNERGQ